MECLDPECKGKAYIERREGGNPFEVQCRKCKKWFTMETKLMPLDIGEVKE